MMTWQCSNCEKSAEAPVPEGTLEIGESCQTPEGTRYKRMIGYICKACQEPVLVMKLVLKREARGNELRFEQYLPVESAK